MDPELQLSWVEIEARTNALAPNSSYAEEESVSEKEVQKKNNAIIIIMITILICMYVCMYVCSSSRTYT